jgi:AraC-like DNA-binding protein
MKTRPTGTRETPRRCADWARWRANTHGVELLEAEFTTHVYERHIHESYALGVTLSGVQRFWCRGATRDSTAGDVIAINPGEAHDGESGTNVSYSYRMIYVPLEVMRAFVQDATERQPIDIHVVAPLFTNPWLARQLDAAWHALADPSRMLAGEELLSTALFRIHAGHPRLQLPPEVHLDMRALWRVRDYLHARIEDDVRVGELAQVAAMSRFRLTRQFQQAFGLPLHAYHLHLRLEESKRRLRSGVPAVRVAADLGFADQSHFHRRFNGAFGMTPDAWRRAAQGEPAES